MDVGTVMAGFPRATPLEGLPGAWYWRPVPGLRFVGTPSCDGQRLLQVNAAGSFDARAVAEMLRFARGHEEAMFAANRHMSCAGGFRGPGMWRFDALAGVGPAVHDFYSLQRPELTARTRIFFLAYEQEFSGREDLEDARARYDMLPAGLADRPPVPWVKMRYINTRTRSHSIGPQRGFTHPDVLTRELRDMEGGQESMVEFEDRHGKVWRVKWNDGWWYADWTDQTGKPAEISIEDLVAFAHRRIHS